MIRLLIPLFLCVVTVGFSQTTLSTKSKKAIELYTEADNYRVRGQYDQAINLLSEALGKDKNFVEAYYRIGLVYMSTREYPKAINSFETGLALTDDIRKQKVFWYDLGECYLLIGEYEKGKETLSKFLNTETQNVRKIDRAKMLYNTADFAIKNSQEKAAYNLRSLSDTVNAFAMQYFPVLTADQQLLFFTRRKGNGASDDEDLVVSQKGKDGKFGAPQSISSNINSILNEGTCTISADGRKLIFTSCEGRQGLGSCDLYESIKTGSEWSKPKNLGPMINSNEWESQPSLSADGRTLYFVSDRRGGLGRRDIWVSYLDDNDQWMKATNLGRSINSQYDEISPFIHVNNQVLYFASNGLTGFGGYDIFYSERNGEESWTQPVNVGRPINNHQDQFSLFITADGKKGYYSNEEFTDKGFSAGRIYEMDIPEESQLKFRSNYIKGIVSDKATSLPLKSVIELIDLEQDKVVSKVFSDSINGEYLMTLTQGAEYALYVRKQGYLFKSLNFNYSVVKDFEPITLNIALEKVSVGSVAVLNNIFFDFNSYTINNKSISELQKIISFMNENAEVRIEISGHTDNIGTESYNQNLSTQRAQAVTDYLIAGGISSKRLISKGFGSTKPISSNDTEEGRQLNRRIEFKIL